MACFGIAEAIRTAPTAVIEVLLGIFPYTVLPGPLTVKIP
jgi:hypothetical protein